MSDNVDIIIQTEDINNTLKNTSDSQILRIEPRGGKRMVLSGLQGLKAGSTRRNKAHLSFVHPHPKSIIEGTEGRVKTQGTFGTTAAMAAKSATEYAKATAKGIKSVVSVVQAYAVYTTHMIYQARGGKKVIEADVTPTTELTTPSDYDYMNTKLSRNEMSVFRCLADTGECRIKELADKTGLSPREVFNAVRTGLVGRGFAEIDPRNQECYVLTGVGIKAFSYLASLESMSKDTKRNEEKKEAIKYKDALDAKVREVVKAPSPVMLRCERRDRLVNISDDSTS